ncbi:MAG: hypothetical protein ACOYM7_08310 [Paludibacter sp.]
MKKLIYSIFALIFSVTMFAQTAGILTVTYTTNGTSSKNANAVYITNSAGALVNTMMYRTSNGNSSCQDMTTYWSKIGSSWSTSASKLLTTADAVTGATVSSSSPLLPNPPTYYWGKLASISSVTDGTYTVNFETANYSASNRRYTSGTFVKGPNPSTVNLTTVTGFTSPVLTWTPANTALKDVEIQKIYSLYPTQAVSSIYVSGLDIEGIDICSLSAQILKHSIEQRVNISGLPKGAYLAVIYSKAGMVVKKFQKI